MSEKQDEKKIALLIIVAAVVVALIAWFLSNGVQTSLLEVKQIILQNADTLAKIV